MQKTILSTQPYKGTRDFYPEDLKKRNYIFETWKKVLIECGFVEYDCSVIESAEVYLAKSGEELGSKQLYSFTDKGDRKIALRPEMTPSLARMVAGKFGEMKFPIRWFSILVKARKSTCVMCALNCWSSVLCSLFNARILSSSA